MSNIRSTRHIRRRPQISADQEEAWNAEMEQLRGMLRGGKESFRGRSPYANWSGTIRRFMYDLVRRYRANRELNIIQEMVWALPSEPLKVSFAENPFYWSLYAAKNDGEIAITYKEISRYAAQMQYADLHHVPPELLVGFVYQQGNDGDLARKLRDRLTEGWSLPDPSSGHWQERW